MAAARCAALAGVVAVATGFGATPRDSPSIVLGKSIGAIRLGMSRERVERVYGRATRIERSRKWFPQTTRYAGELLDRRWYRAGTGTIGVWYLRGRVKVVETNSSRYRLPGRVHAGSRIAIRRCGGPTTVCWRGFGVDDCTGLLIDWGRRITSYVAFAHRGPPRAGRFRITRIGFGYNDVLLLCF